MPIIRIPTPLRKLTDNMELVTVSGDTVHMVFQNLETKYTGFSERIFDENGSIRRFINVYLNNEDIRFLQNLATPVQENDEISIVPAVAGG